MSEESAREKWENSLNKNLIERTREEILKANNGNVLIEKATLEYPQKYGRRKVKGSNFLDEKEEEAKEKKED